uniref:Glutamyl-tRNA(Gln) amidotransferase subunit B, mitochondrial n=1 Tax=Culicoides sonorensis TaxID=179676 RepID=A0A336KRT3_CULSO
MFVRLFNTHYFKRGITSHVYKGVVGLEVHAQLSSKSKLFSRAPNKFNAPVNSCVDNFDAAIPGTLPVLNKFCVEAAVKIGLVMNCILNMRSTFDRKHYFYADMPSGYQITQQSNPIAKQGYIEFPIIHKKQVISKICKLIQIQLEQDSGKSLHDIEARKVLIDLNRAGAPLVEFVFCPDLEDGYQAAALVKELCLILTAIKVCSCKMEEGALRVDANVSVHKPGQPLGTRTEVKNIGSISGIQHAVDYEINRQTDILMKNGRIINETRTWDAVKQKTLPMRDKEVVLDYRFIPEPNLLPVYLSNEDTDEENVVSITRLAKKIPELPSQSRMRLINEYHLNDITAFLLVDDLELLKIFDKILSDNPNRNPKYVSNILTNNVRTLCNKKKCQIIDLKLTHIQIGQVVDLLENQTINQNFVLPILEILEKNENYTAEIIVENKNWQQILDNDTIENVCRNIIKNNSKLVNQYFKGKDKTFFALAGLIAKEMDGRINMGKATEKLKSILNEEKDIRNK